MGDVEVHDQFLARAQLGLRAGGEQIAAAVKCVAEQCSAVGCSTSTRSDWPLDGSISSNQRQSVRRPNSCGTRYGGSSGACSHVPSSAPPLRSG